MDALGGVIEPVDVVDEPEDAAIVRPNPFEYAVSIEEPVVKDLDDSLGLLKELPVHVD